MLSSAHKEEGPEVAVRQFGTLQSRQQWAASKNS